MCKRHLVVSLSAAPSLETPLHAGWEFGALTFTRGHVVFYFIAGEALTNLCTAIIIAISLSAVCGCTSLVGCQ